MQDIKHQTSQGREAENDSIGWLVFYATILYQYLKYSYETTALIMCSKLGTGGVHGQGKGQQLMGIKAVNDYIGLATCQSWIYEK